MCGLELEGSGAAGLFIVINAIYYTTKRVLYSLAIDNGNGSGNSVIVYLVLVDVDIGDSLGKYLIVVTVEEGHIGDGFVAVRGNSQTYIEGLGVVNVVAGSVFNVAITIRTFNKDVVDTDEVALSAVVVECNIDGFALILREVYFVVRPFAEGLIVGSEYRLLCKVGGIVAGCRDEHTVSG